MLYDVLLWAAAGVASLLVWSLVAYAAGTVIGRVVRNRDNWG